MPKQSRPFCFSNTSWLWQNFVTGFKTTTVAAWSLNKETESCKTDVNCKMNRTFTNQAQGLYGWILAQGCASTHWKQRRTRPSICHYSSSKQFYWVVYYIALRLNLFILWKSGTKEPIRRLRFTSRLPSHKITSNYWMRSSMISCKTIFSNCLNLHFLQVFSHFEFLQTFNDTKRMRGLET